MDVVSVYFRLNGYTYFNNMYRHPAVGLCPVDILLSPGLGSDSGIRRVRGKGCNRKKKFIQPFAFFNFYGIACASNKSICNYTREE